MDVSVIGTDAAAEPSKYGKVDGSSSEPPRTACRSAPRSWQRGHRQKAFVLFFQEQLGMVKSYEPDDSSSVLPFVPDTRQRALADAAVRVRMSGVEPGNFVPAELARRMQLEADLSTSSPATGEAEAPASSSPDINELAGATFFDRRTFAALQVEVKPAAEHGGQGGSASARPCCGAVEGASVQTKSDAGSPFNITMSAVLNESVSQEALEKLLGPEFSKARLYWRRPLMLAVERLVCAPSKLDATLRVAEDIKAAFPEAEMVDVSGLPRNLIEALDEMAYDGALTEQALEEASGPFAKNPGFGIARGTSVCWVEAEVFEVFDTPELIHLRSEDNRIYAFNRGTAVWNAFEKVDVGQRFRCLIASRYGVVLRAVRLAGEAQGSSHARLGDR